MDKKNVFLKYIIFLVLIYALRLSISTMDTGKSDFLIKGQKECMYTEFQSKLESGLVDSVYIDFEGEVSDNKFYFYSEEQLFLTDNPNYDDFKKDLLANDVKVYPKDDVKDSFAAKIDVQDASLQLLSLIQMIVLVKFLCDTMLNLDDKNYTGNQKGRKNKILNKTNDNKTETTFEDVAGLVEAKQELKSIVDFLKNGDKYIEAGAKLPKGIIFHGPPGTGKTLLSRAIAGEANVPYFYMNGSDFVEMYVGMGARRVRNLFNEAKKNAPAIIFIDEIDAVGGTRGRETGNSEDRKTLNALLTEMDGFKTSEDIIVIAATNRIEDIDPALLRAGRFTEQIFISKPITTEERLEVIKLYSKNKKFAEDIDFTAFAKETIGCSPADIEAIINDAAILSVQNQKMFIDNECLYKAYYKRITGGSTKEQSERDQKEVELVAVHESGHAVIGTILNEDVTRVTIVPSTNGTGGVTISIPKKMGLYSETELKNKVKQLYAGRAAEEVFFDGKENVTTGAQKDIEQATEILYEMVSVYGMNGSKSLVNYEKFKNKDCILEKIEELSSILYDETKELVYNNFEKINAMKAELIEKETLDKKDILRLAKMEE